MAEETTYAEGEPAYIDGTEAYYTFVLRKNAANGNIEIVTDKFRFLRWEVYSYLRKYNLKLNGFHYWYEDDEDWIRRVPKFTKDDILKSRERAKKLALINFNNFRKMTA
jgi:hypothetical protein